jgi:hypothetical protein
MAKQKAGELMLAEALTAAALVDKSHEGLHKALGKLVPHCVMRDQLDFLSQYVKVRRDINATALTTIGVERWITDVCLLNIGKNGDVTKKPEDGIYNAKWRENLRKVGWHHKVVSDLFKVPEQPSINNYAKVVAERAFLGDPIPSDDEVLADFRKAYATVINGKKFQEWKQKAVKAANDKGLGSVEELLKAAG